MARRLTFAHERELYQRIWNLAWPTIVYNLLEMMVGLVDLAMVRPFGEAATAAVGVGRQVTFLVEVSAIAIATGVITLVSQNVGAGAAQQAGQVVRQSLWLVFVLGLPTALAGYLLSRPILVGLSAGSETLAHGVPYLRTYFAGLVFVWGNLLGAAVFRGAGDSLTPLKLALGVNLLNVALNYVFIYGAGPVPAFHVQGAALGTVAARALGALVYLAFLCRSAPSGIDFQGESWGADWKLMGRMLRIGVPMALAALLRNGSWLVFLAIVGASTLGTALHAALGVGLQLRRASVLPALAFQVAAAALVGQAIGRHDFHEAERMGRRTVLLLALLMAAVTAAMIALAEPLAKLFIASPDVARLGAQVVRWFAVAQFFSAVSIGVQGALMGAGDTVPTLHYTLVSQWLIMLPLTWWFVAIGWVPEGPLLAWTVAPAIGLALILRRFASGRWQDARR